jgi:hypothetical protein
MPITINGTTGIAGVDGSASTPSIQGADTNTGMFFPAADTIAFAEGGAEVMRIDSAGNVGIGTTSPSSFDSTGNKLVIGSGVGNQGITIFSGTSSAGNILFAEATTAPEAYKGVIRYDQASDFMSYWTNGVERVRITSAGAREFLSQNSNFLYAGDATFTLSGSNITFDLATVFPDLVGNGSGMGIMLLINQWNGSPNTGYTQITLGQKSSSWSFTNVSAVNGGSGLASTVTGSGTVITVTSGAGYGQVRVWVTSRN